ncbi:hypothetical protein CPLU01_01987 [Colletotrichum plurivorum]|uniref:Uncharacterized protein n=1 Tax=Colletotrichum plurivorum TaxID=2175906 RepID=A0A8H6KX24_9PEZI|nr:hypothetical protein CPLU01_01987 [Colletotrichum plurivorum]
MSQRLSLPTWPVPRLLLYQSFASPVIKSDRPGIAGHPSPSAHRSPLVPNPAVLASLSHFPSIVLANIGASTSATRRASTQHSTSWQANLRFASSLHLLPRDPNRITKERIRAAETTPSGGYRQVK